MSYGLQITNNSGVIQIGTGISNFYMVDKGTVTAIANTLIASTGFPSLTTISVAQAFDCLVVSPNCFTRPFSTFATQRAAGPIDIPGNGDAGTINWYAFTSYKNLTPSTSNYALQVFNADGTLGFSSNQPKIMKVYQRIPITTGASLSTPVSNSLPTGKTFGFIQYGIVAKYVSVPSGMGATDINISPLVKYTSGNVDIEFATRAGRNQDGLDHFEGGLAVIDVTGY